MARADKISPKIKVPEYYSDFRINMDKTPVTGELDRLTNEEAVKQAIVNIVMTQRGERFYNYDLGSDIRSSLFGMIDDPISADTIKESIKRAIEDYEPRALLQDISLKPDVDNNSLTVTIFFSTINSQDVFTAIINIERVR